MNRGAVVELVRQRQRLVLAGLQLGSGAVLALGYLSSIHGGVPSAFSAAAHGLLLIAIVGCALGVGLLGRDPDAVLRRTSTADALIATTGISVLVWLVLLEDASGASDLSLPRHLGSLAGPVAAVLLLMLVLRLVFSDPGSTPAKFLLTAWGCLQLTGAAAYGRLALEGRWTSANPVFLVWLGALGCLIAAAAHPSMRHLGPSPLSSGRVPRVVVLASVLVLPVALVVRIVQQDAHDLTLISAATLVVFLLTLWRDSAVHARRSTRAGRTAAFRLVAVFTVAALLPLALMAESSIRLAERVVVKDARDRVSTTSAVSAQLVRQQMEGLRQLVGAYAERRLLSTALGDGALASMDTDAVQRHLVQLRAATPGLDGVFVTDFAGRLGEAAPSTPSLVGGENLSAQDWYRGARSAGRAYVSQAYSAEVTGDEHRTIAVAAPVRRVGGQKVLGFLVAVYDLRALQAFSDELARAQGVGLRITDQRGTVVADPGNRSDSLVDDSGEAGIAQALRGTGSLGTVRDEDGVQILCAYAPVPGLGWTVTAQVPTATAYASLGQLRSTVLAVAVLLAQVLLGGLVLMVRAQRQRQEAERSLLERDRSTSAILEASGDAYVAIDESNVIVAWSGQAEKLFGWSAQEAHGSVLTELIVPPAFKQRHGGGVRRLVSTGVPRILGQRLELSAVHREGHEFPIELALWQSDVGGKRFFNAFIHDITVRKQHETEMAEARDRALETSRLKTEFLAVMSHELRTPMNGVLGMTSLLLGTALSAQQREYAETVRSSADSLLELLNDILDLSKVEADRLELEVLDFGLDQVVRDIVQLLQLSAQEKGIALTAGIDDDVHRALRGDPGRLRQVLLNLVGNAVKFTSEGSVSLRVLAEPSGPGPVCLRFEVTDTGIGIAPQARARVFESFSQADASTTREYGGTGLGLAISQKLVALFQGEIGVESELGRGSTFWFTARFEPGELVPPPAEHESGSLDPQPGAPPGLVLVVDDNATNQKIAVRMLERLGHRADVAADGAEAVKAWASVPYDLILMDCRMPVMDGYEATRTIRGTEAAGRRIPIVAMTASAMVDDRERCLDAGMDDFLSKPVQLNHLRDKVDHWLNRSAPRTTPVPAPAPPPAEEGLPVLDQDIVRELDSYEAGFFVSLAQEFLTTMPDRVAQIRADSENADTGPTARSAHALRGAAANLGGARLAQVCAQIEEAAQSEEAGPIGRADQVRELIPLLEHEAARLRQAMTAVIEVGV